jgi:hypothetical protein
VVPNATTHSTTLTFANVCIPVLDYNQRDLIYAVSLNRTKTSNNSNVTFRFKHALAQLIFKLKCTNDNLYVMANGVNVYHVPRVGTLSFGTTDTGTDSEDLCTWSNVQASTQTISIDMDHGTGNIAEAFNYRTYNSDGTIATSGSLIEAITNDAANNPDKATGLMVIPTTYTSWVPPTDLTGWDSSTLGISGTTYQTYVGLKCRVWRFSNKAAKNISSATFFDDTQAHAESCLREMDAELVYGGADGSFSEILIPLPTTTDNAAGGTWKAGWKYIYTFVFGSGDGGYSPDDGNKVLRSIGFGMEITPFDNTLVDRDHDMEEVESGS